MTASLSNFPPAALGYVNPDIVHHPDGSLSAEAYFDPLAPSDPTRQADLRMMKKGNVRLVALSCGNIDSDRLPGSAGVEYVARVLTALRRAIERRPRHCRVVLNREDLSGVLSDSHIGVLLHLTGSPLNGCLQNLDVFHLLGARAIHPFSDDPSVGGFSGWNDTRRGLTKFGRGLLRRAQELRMVVDLAHANDRTFREALGVCSGPVINSHSNARALRNLDRNSTDAQLKAIAETGGVTGVHFSSSFLQEPSPEAVRQRAEALERGRKTIDRLAKRYPNPYEFLSRRMNGALFDEAAGGSFRAAPVIRAPLGRLADHLLHLMEVAGEDHVALGSDYSLGDICAGVHRVSGLHLLAEELLRRGAGRATLEKIMWRNWARVLRKILPGRPVAHA